MDEQLGGDAFQMRARIGNDPVGAAGTGRVTKVRNDRMGADRRINPQVAEAQEERVPRGKLAGARRELARNPSANTSGSLFAKALQGLAEAVWSPAELCTKLSETAAGKWAAAMRGRDEDDPAHLWHRLVEERLLAGAGIPRAGRRPGRWDVRRPSARAAIRYSGPSSSPGCRPGCGRRRPSGRRPRPCRRDRRPDEPAAGTAAASGPRRGWSRRWHSGTSRIGTFFGVRGRPRGPRSSGPSSAGCPRGHGSRRQGPCPAHKAGASRAGLGRAPAAHRAAAGAAVRSELIAIPGESPAALSEVRISTIPAAQEQRVTVIIKISFGVSLCLGSRLTLLTL